MVLVPLPAFPALEQLLGVLLGREVKVSAHAASAPSGPLATASYVCDEPDLKVVVLCELELACGMGAALSLMPPAAARDCAKARAMDASLQENFAEVMNVVARYVSMSGRRFSLAELHCPPAAAPPELLAAASGSDEQRPASIEIHGYGSGRLTFCTV